MPEVSILDHGADPLATDNRAAFTAAITACHAAGGGVVRIPAGVWNVVADHWTIQARSGVTLKGDGRQNSTVRVHESSGDWHDLFMHRNPAVTGFGFEDFTIDAATADTNPTETVVGSSIRTPIYSIGHDLRVERMRIHTNGRWGIRNTGSGMLVRDTEFINDLTHWDHGWFDQSIIWTGGENQTIEDCHIRTKGSTWPPMTCIEIQGHRHKVKDNILDGHQIGVLFTVSTLFDPGYIYWSMAERGAKAGLIQGNQIRAYRSGVDIWGMHVLKDDGTPDYVNPIAGLKIHDNDIHMDNGANGHRIQYFAGRGIGFRLGNPNGETIHDRDQIAPVHDLSIRGNRIHFTDYVPESRVSAAECGIKALVDISMQNVMFEDNTVRNCGGYAALAEVVDWDTLSTIKGFSVVNNKLVDTRDTFYHGLRTSGVEVTGNRKLAINQSPTADTFATTRRKHAAGNTYADLR